MVTSGNQFSNKKNIPSNPEAEENSSASPLSPQGTNEEKGEVASIKEKLNDLEILLESAQKARLQLIKQKKATRKHSPKKKKKKDKQAKLRKLLRKTLNQNISLYQEIIQIRVQEIEEWRQQLESSASNAE